MSATTIQPNLKLFPGLSFRLMSLKPIYNNSTFPYCPTSKLVLSGSLVFKKGFSQRNSYLGCPKTMSEVIKTPAFRRSNGDEGVKTIEQEGLVGGSSEFRSGFMTNGLESALNKLSKWIVSGLFAAVLLGRHDADAVWAAMGSTINAVLSIALKRILNQERPTSAMKSDPGMPSSHAQSIFFIFIFAILSIVEWLGINDITLVTSVFVLALGSYLSWLRVSQGLHTVSQVVVGAIVGSIFCIFWYWTWNAFVLQAFNSSLWVQVIVILGAAAFCLGFVFYVYQNWFKDEL